jgi:hypothetical protein
MWRWNISTGQKCGLRRKCIIGKEKIINYSRKGETETVLLGIFREVIKIFVKIICFSIYVLYSEREKYGINSLKIKHNIFQKNLWTGQF